MAVDLKYGRVTLERSTIADDEPVVVFRAQDAALPALLVEYGRICASVGSPPHHLAAVERSRRAVLAWQADHPPRVPTSDSLAPRRPDPDASFGTADPSPHRDSDGG
jgi:hypothetical protein